MSNRLFGSQWFEGVGFGDIVQRIRHGMFPGNKEAQSRIRLNLQQGVYPDPEFMRRYIGSPSNSEGEQDTVTFARVARVKTEAGEEQVPVKSGRSSGSGQQPPPPPSKDPPPPSGGGGGGRQPPKGDKAKDGSDEDDEERGRKKVKKEKRRKKRKGRSTGLQAALLILTLGETPVEGEAVVANLLLSPKLSQLRPSQRLPRSVELEATGETPAAPVPAPRRHHLTLTETMMRTRSPSGSGRSSKCMVKRRRRRSAGRSRTT
jgi:hypothetical protein